jgi:two-component system chemotaxis response regulator CheB
MPPGFTASLAERLNNISNIKVKEAKNGDEIYPGVALIAPGDYHMELVENNSAYRVSLNQNPPHKGVRPSVDILFNSIARNCNLHLLGIILTGMGSDGSIGIKEIKNRNGKVIVQDKESCVVFGMLGSALATNCVDETVPLHSIAKRIEEIVISKEKIK